MDAAQPARVGATPALAVRAHPSRRWAACWLTLLLLLAGAAHATEPRLDVYVRESCPRCAAAKAHLERLKRERPELDVRYHFVDRDGAALAELARRSRAAGVEPLGVPTFAVGDELVVGFESAETTGPAIEALLARGARAPPSSAPGSNGACRVDEASGCEPLELEPADQVETRFGTVSVSRLGLPLLTLVLGLLDGFNPCAMWVLLFLISMLVGLEDRRHMALIAGTFVLTSGAVYFAFMAAWLNVFLLLGFSRTIQVVLGLVALGVGALNVKDFFAFKRGLSLSIPESAKPGIYARVRSILRAPTLGPAVGGAAVLALLVNFVELLCTAGLPAVYTAILARHELSPWGHYGYLALYNLAYITDDALMVTIAVFTLTRRKLTERAGRWLKLVSGIVMLALAAALIFAPELLL